jgi:hypothetical protein
MERPVFEILFGAALVCGAAGTTLTVQGANAASYVQKGLVACYDGIENAGAGVHAPNATTILVR